MILQIMRYDMGINNNKSHILKQLCGIASSSFYSKEFPFIFKFILRYNDKVTSNFKLIFSVCKFVTEFC